MSRFAFLQPVAYFQKNIGHSVRVLPLPTVTRRSMLALIVSVIVFGILYIWQINSLATLGYQVKDLEMQKNTLQKSYDDLSLQVTDKTSSEYVINRLKALDMVGGGTVKYVSIPGSVALSK